MQRFAVCVLVMAPFFAAGPALGDGMKVEPGKWEFKSTSRMSMAPSPQTRVETQCVTDSAIDPQTFMRDAKDCEFTDVASDDSSMTWKMTCTNSGGQMKGQGSFRSTGSTIQGKMTMAMSANGQQMTLEHEWEGRRLGSCD